MSINAGKLDVIILPSLPVYNLLEIDLLIDQAIGPLWKRLASIIAVKGDRVKYKVLAFNMTTLHCNDNSQSLQTAQLLDLRQAGSTFLCATLYSKMV